jgi:hypothetical protein
MRNRSGFDQEGWFGHSLPGQNRPRLFKPYSTKSTRRLHGGTYGEEPYLPCEERDARICNNIHVHHDPALCRI